MLKSILTGNGTLGIGLLGIRDFVKYVGGGRSGSEQVGKWGGRKVVKE